MYGQGELLAIAVECRSALQTDAHAAIAGLGPGSNEGSEQLVVSGNPGTAALDAAGNTLEYPYVPAFPRQDGSSHESSERSARH